MLDTARFFGIYRIGNVVVINLERRKKKKKKERRKWSWQDIVPGELAWHGLEGKNGVFQNYNHEGTREKMDWTCYQRALCSKLFQSCTPFEQACDGQLGCPLQESERYRGARKSKANCPQAYSTATTTTTTIATRARISVTIVYMGLRDKRSWTSEIVRAVSITGPPGRIASLCFNEFSIDCTLGRTRETYGEIRGSYINFAQYFRITYSRMHIHSC